jgi:hypothetical protein
MEVKEIESDIPLPQSVVPKKIWDYVASNYPNNKIFEWKKREDTKKWNSIMTTTFISIWLGISLS